MFKSYFSHFNFDYFNFIQILPAILKNASRTFFGFPKFCSPVFITWAVTLNCQMKCKQCSFTKNQPKMESDESIKIAQAIASSKANGIMLAGGEPLVKDNFFTLVEILKKSKKKINIATNGLLLEKFHRQILESEIDNIIISLDGIDDIHDDLRNYPGAYRQILNGIMALINSRGRHPKITVRFTISKKNYRILPEFIKIFYPLVDHVCFQPIQNNRLFHIDDLSILFDPSDQKEFELLWASLQKSYSFLRTKFYNYLPQYIFERDLLFQKINWSCMPLTTMSLDIYPNGDVCVCPAFERNLGNVLKQSIDEIWNNRNTQRVQKRIRDSKCFCWCNYPDLNFIYMKFYNVIKRIKKI